MFKSKDALFVIVAVLGVVIAVFGLAWCQAEMEEGEPSGCRSYPAAFLA